MTKKIFLISGLGADERMFQRLDFGDFTPVYLKWIKPDSNENLKNYAAKIKEQITEENPVLVGLSFGGIMTVEISKQIKTEKIILILSAMDKSEIPKLYKFAAFFKLNKLIPKIVFKQSNFFVNWLFGAKSKEDKSLLKAVLQDTDLDFAVWAINEIINWKNDFVPENLHRIHGSEDHLLPLKIAKPDFEIKNGSHLMVLNKADEVSAALQKILN